jgi:hypothetical protein
VFAHGLDQPNMGHPPNTAAGENQTNGFIFKHFNYQINKTLSYGITVWVTLPKPMISVKKSSSL